MICATSPVVADANVLLRTSCRRCRGTGLTARQRVLGPPPRWASRVALAVPLREKTCRDCGTRHVHQPDLVAFRRSFERAKLRAGFTR